MSRDGWRPEPHNRRPQKLPMKVIRMRKWRRLRQSIRQARWGWEGFRVIRTVLLAGLMAVLLVSCGEPPFRGCVIGRKYHPERSGVISTGKVTIPYRHSEWWEIRLVDEEGRKHWHRVDQYLYDNVTTETCFR